MNDDHENIKCFLTFRISIIFGLSNDSNYDVCSLMRWFCISPCLKVKKLKENNLIIVEFSHTKLNYLP